MSIDAFGDVTVDGVSLRGLPKVSLLDHLHAAVRPATVIELAAMQDIELPAADADGLVAWMLQLTAAGTHEASADALDPVLAVLQTPEALVRVAREYVEDLAADGVIYAEVRVTPELHIGDELSLEDVLDAVDEGLGQGEDSVLDAGGEIQVNVIVSARRDSVRSTEVARLAIERREDGVVAFDISGPESGHPAYDHRTAFDEVADALLPATVHAGETEGVDSIRSAIVDGRALRLGHGVRVAQDLELVARKGDDVQVRFGDLARWVRDRETPLELAPSAELQTGAIEPWGDQIADHPFDLLYQLGFAVTVNTASRTLARTSLTRELALLVEAFEYDLDDIAAFQLNAAAAAFLPVEEREALVEQLGEAYEH